MLRFDCGGLGAMVVLGKTAENCTIAEDEYLTTLASYTVIKANLKDENDKTILATFLTQHEAAAFIRANAAKILNAEETHHVED